MGRNRLLMIVDPDPESRGQVTELLRDAPYAVVADTGYGADASQIAEEASPEIVVVAIQDPVDDALHAIEEIRAVLPSAAIVAYSHLTDIGVIRKIMQSGVRDLLPQPLEGPELVTALDAVESTPAVARPEAAAEPATGTAAPRRMAGTVLTVFGAKGGIGKSTIATNLGASIAKDTEYSVLIMDMDTRFGDIAIMLDMEPRFTISDLALASDSLDRDSFMRALMEHESGAFILAAPKHPSEWANVTAEQMQTIVKFASRIFDYVILDTPGTFNDIVATSIEVADQVLVITSLDMASIKDTVHMLDLLEAEGYPDERLLLVVNQVNRATTVKPDDVPRIVHQDVFWTIPYDEQVLFSNSIGQPIVMAKPKSGAARQLRGLAQKITHGNVSDVAGGRFHLPRILKPWTFLRRGAA